MPNWCECDLTIWAAGKDKEQQLRDFVAFAQGSTKGDLIEFEKFIPYPTQFEEMDKIYVQMNAVWDEMRKAAGMDEKVDKVAYAAWQKKNPRPYLSDAYNHGGYEWCVANWGTKWGACSCRISSENYDRGRIFYQFETAWSPPTPVILAMSQRFPKLKFTMRYYEQGVAYQGVYRARAGKVLQDESRDYQGTRGG